MRNTSRTIHGSGNPSARSPAATSARRPVAQRHQIPAGQAVSRCGGRCRKHHQYISRSGSNPNTDRVSREYRQEAYPSRLSGPPAVGVRPLRPEQCEGNSYCLLSFTAAAVADAAAAVGLPYAVATVATCCYGSFYPPRSRPHKGEPPTAAADAAVEDDLINEIVCCSLDEGIGV